MPESGTGASSVKSKQYKEPGNGSELDPNISIEIVLSKHVADKDTKKSNIVDELSVQVLQPENEQLMVKSAAIFSFYCWDFCLPGSHYVLSNQVVCFSVLQNDAQEGEALHCLPARLLAQRHWRSTEKKGVA